MGLSGVCRVCRVVATCRKRSPTEMRMCSLIFSRGSMSFRLSFFDFFFPLAAARTAGR
jgi:hypothetical protein